MCVFSVKNKRYYSLENHKMGHLLNPMEWIIICQGGVFHPLGNRTRVPVTAIRAIWITCEVRTSLAYVNALNMILSYDFLIKFESITIGKLKSFIYFIKADSIWKPEHKFRVEESGKAKCRFKFLRNSQDLAIY